MNFDEKLRRKINCGDCALEYVLAKLNMSLMQSRSSLHQEDSLVISDSDDEETESPIKGQNLTDMRVIKDSDSESTDVSAASSNDDGTESEYEGQSEDEDLQFVNSSHRVSIIENSSESDSESSKSPVNYTTARVKSLKRRSIYESPSTSHTPKSESTPINSRLRKRAKRIIESDSEDENISGNHKYQSADKNKSQGNNQEYKMSNKMNISESSVEEHHDKETSSESLAEERDIVEDKIRDESIPGHSELSTSSIDNSNSKNGSIRSPIARNIISANTNVVDLTINDSNIRREKIDLTFDEYNKDDPQVSPNNKNLQKKQNISEVIISSSSTSETEMDKDVLSIAKKEIGVGNIDPIEAQKRELLHIDINKKQTELDKLKKFTASCDMAKLPDKGAKVREKMIEYEENIAKLKAKLEKLSQNRKTLNISEKIKSPRERLAISPKKHKSFMHSSYENKENINVKSNVEKKAEKDKIVKKSDAYSNHFDDFDIHDIPKVPETSFNPNDLGKKALETLNKQQSLTHKSLEQLHGSLVSRPAENKLEPDPSGLKIKLMPHQQHALAWMKWRETQKPKGGILADDMGLGKTLTMISLVLATIDNVRGHDSESTDSDSDDGWYSRKKTKKHKRYYGGTLVICPASLIKQWESEVNNRCKRGMLSVLVFHGNNRNIDDRKLSKFNIVITTYQTLVREAERETSMYKMEWNRVILDEAHYIRNHKSKACIAACGVNARHRWALTGTPIQNKEMDVFAILKYLQCSPFNDLQVWRRWVDNKNDAGKQRLITIMKTLMLRRTKQELQAKGALESLPSKSLEIIEIEMDRDETLAYQKILLFSQNLFAQFLSQRAEKAHMKELYGGKYDRPSYASSGAKTQFTKAQKVMLAHHSNVEVHDILVLLLRLRQMCCHPALIHSMLDQNDAEVNGLDDSNSHSEVLNKLKNMSINEDDSVEDYVASYKIDERVAANLLTKKNPVFDDNRRGSKVRRIIKTIEEILEKGDKVVVVSQWTSFLEVIAKNLKRVDDAHCAMFTGAVAVKDRQAIVDRLNDPRENINVLLLSLTAGGVGLNLVGANHLLLIDIHWNPQLESQAQDRIYRFGQKKDVYIYKFICKDTIEERVKNLQDKKLEIANHVLTGTRTVSSKLTIDDLKSLFS